MQLPVKITYRGLDKSDAIDNLVLEHSARLEKFCDHINRCDVAIEQPNHGHQKGNPYRVRIDVTVAPRHELVADVTADETRAAQDTDLADDHAGILRRYR